MTPPPPGRKRGVSRLVELFERPRSNSIASNGHALLSTGIDAASDVSSQAADGGRTDSPQPSPAAAQGNLRINLPVRRGTVKERVEAFSSPLVGDEEAPGRPSLVLQRTGPVVGSNTAKSEGWGSLVRNVEREIASRQRGQNQYPPVSSPTSLSRSPLSPIPSASGSSSGPTSSAGHSVVSASAPSFASQPDSPPPPLTPDSELAHLPLLPLSLPAQAPAPPRLVPVSELFSRDARPLVLPALDRVLDAVKPLQLDLPKEWRTGVEREGWEEWLVSEEEQKWWVKVKRRLGVAGRAGTGRNGAALVKDEGEVGGAGQVRAGSREERQLILPPMHLVPPKLTVTDLKVSPEPATFLASAIADQHQLCVLP